MKFRIPFQLPIVLLILLTAACGTNDSDPAAVARAWVNAVINGEGTTIVLYTCRSSEEDYQMLGMFGGLLNNLSVGGDGGGLGFSVDLDLDIDMRDVHFQTISQNEQVARVLVTGEMRMSMLGIYQSSDVYDEFTLVYEDMRWKVCGSTPSQ